MAGQPATYLVIRKDETVYHFYCRTCGKVKRARRFPLDITLDEYRSSHPEHRMATCAIHLLGKVKLAKKPRISKSKPAPTPKTDRSGKKGKSNDKKGK